MINLAMATATLPDTEKNPPRLRELRPTVRASGHRASPSWQQLAVKIVVALAAGALHAASWLFPGAYGWVWAGQIALIWLAATSRPKAAFAYGVIVGSVGIGCSFYWGIEALRLTVDASPAVALLVYAVLVAIEAVAFGLFGCVVSIAAGRGLRYFWLIPCAWVAIEHWFPRIFPWKFGYSQLEWLALVQIAELVGSVGIGFVATAIAAVPTALVLGWRASSRRIDEWRSAVRYSVAAGLLFASTLGFGIVRERQWTARMAQQPKLKVALIQVDPAFVGCEEKLRSRSLAIHDQVDLVCWPESALGVYSEELNHFRDVDQTLQLSRDSQNSLEPAKDFSPYLLAGAKLYRGQVSDYGPFSMAGLLISPSQDIVGRYRKRTLLPLGEYVPLQSYYPSLRHWMKIDDIVEAGRDCKPLCTSNGHRLGVLICYEDMIARNVRHTAAAGAEALFSLIQGTAFENPLTLIQHQRLALMRAVENRRYFVRCASTGITCIISPTGEIVGQLPPQTEGTLVGQIALINGRTLYNRIGDSFAWLCTFVTVAFVVGHTFGQKRRGTMTA